MRYRCSALLLMVPLCLLCGVNFGYGADVISDPFAAGESFDYDAPIEANADQLDYDKEKGRIIASGNVVITYGTDKLLADKVLVNTETGDAYALGHVVIKRKGMKDVKGSKLTYNFKSRSSSIDDPVINMEPFHSTAEKISRGTDKKGQTEYILHNARVTTCIKPYPHSHYSMKAKRVSVVPHKYLKTKGAVLSLGRIPVFYIPYWRHNLDGKSGFRFYPGYRNRMGAFLLSSYYHPVGEFMKAEHHVDYRTKRGFGLGEDWDWNTATATGKLRLYYLNDQAPDEDTGLPPGVTIDSQRYRIGLSHSQRFGNRTSLILQGDYLSDPRVLDDFFNREYRHQRQPENYATLSHRTKLATYTILANTRLNDFYSNVNRLPELSMNFNRTQVGNSSFYYESYTAGSMLEQVWEDYSDNKDYSTARLDTKHMMYQPRKYFGWLTLVPRAGVRATYYSDTMISSTTTNISSVITTNSASPVIRTNVITSVADGSSKVRGVFEVGAEISFKAFRKFSNGTKRHIVEPYANYTYSIDPNVEPDELYQFDQVDALKEENNIMLGVRNKIQNKRDGRPNDLADINTWTTVNFHTEDNEDAFDKLYLDSDFYPNSWIYLNLYGHYSVADSTLEEFNTRVYITRKDAWRFNVEHRYRDDESNLLNGNMTIYPSTHWAFAVFGRYEFENSRVEEEGGYIEHKLDCIGMRLGGSILPGYTRDDGTEERDDYRIILSVWLTAFPNLGISSGY